MPTGERRPPRGFTYLWLLFLLAAGGAALAAAGQQWSARLQREREIELVARGREIAAAIGAYHAAPGIEPAAWPRGFDDLLEDRRGVALRRHLRRAYADPFTGRADWLPITMADEGWRGVRSRSDAIATLRLDEDPPPDDGRPLRVGDRQFVPRPRAPAASAPTPDPAPSAPP